MYLAARATVFCGAPLCFDAVWGNRRFGSCTIFAGSVETALAVLGYVGRLLFAVAVTAVEVDRILQHFSGNRFH